MFTPPVVSKADGPIATLQMASQGGGDQLARRLRTIRRPTFSTSTRRARLRRSVSCRPHPGAAPDFAITRAPPRPVRERPAARVRAQALAVAAKAGAPGVDHPRAASREAAVRPAQCDQISTPATSSGRSPTVRRRTPSRINPALKGLNIPRTGRPGNVGTLVTKTLVISGEPGFGITSTGQRGAMLRAYDKKTGDEVGAVYMPAPQSGSPMTYMLNGRQYIIVAISGAGYSAELIAFRLPAS